MYEYHVRVEVDPIGIEESKPLVCRGCLAAERPLQSLGRALATLYDQLVGTDGPEADAYPQWVCSYCCTLLLKFSKFRDKCRSSQDKFLRIHSTGVCVTADLLKPVAGLPYPNLQLTRMQTLNLGGPDNLFPANKEIVSHQVPVKIEDGNDHVTLGQLRKEDGDEELIELNELVPVNDGNKSVISCKEEIFDHLPDTVTNNNGIDNVFDSGNYKMGFNENSQQKAKEPKTVPRQTILNYSLFKDDVQLKVESTEDNAHALLLAEATYSTDDSDSDNSACDDSNSLCKASTSQAKDKYTNKATKNVMKTRAASRKINTKRSAQGDVTRPRVKQEFHNSYLDSDTKDAVKTVLENVTTVPRKMKPTRHELSKLSLSTMQKVIDYVKDEMKKKEAIKPKKIKKEVVKVKKLTKKQIRKQDREAIKLEDSPIEKHIQHYETYNLKVILLTQEEQIERIKARKDSSKYKNANFTCDLCYCTFTSKNTLKNHMERHDSSCGTYICEVCKTRYDSNRKLKQHTLRQHMFEYICKECGTVCTHSTQAYNHYQFHKGVTHECKICGKSYTRHTSLASHVHLAHGGTVQCTICNETFIGELGLKAHMSLSHKEAKGAVCAECDVQFHSVAALQRHREAGNHSHRPCVVCGEGFLTEELLQQHKLDEHKERFKMFKCDNCGEQYDTLKKLRQHFLSHLRTKLDPKGDYICEVCGVTKKGKISLMLHVNTHTKPFVCSVCDHRFATKFTLMYHQTRVHKMKPSPTTRKVPLKAAKPHQEFRCQYCHKQFSTKRNRGRHEDLVHRKIRYNKCETCGSQYADKSALQLHINTKHLGLPWPKRNRKERRHVMGTRDYEDGMIDQMDVL